MFLNTEIPKIEKFYFGIIPKLRPSIFRYYTKLLKLGKSQFR